MAQLLGKALIKANGVELATKRGASLKMGGPKRNAVVGSQSVHGFSEETTAPMLTCKITQKGKVDLKFVDAIADATIVWTGDDGVSYVLTGAWCSGESELNEVDGEISASFSALSCDRI